MADRVDLILGQRAHKASLIFFRDVNKAAGGHGPKSPYPYTRADDARDILKWWREAFIRVAIESARDDDEREFVFKLIQGTIGQTRWPLVEVEKFAKHVESASFTQKLLTSGWYREAWTESNRQRARQWRLFGTAMQQSLVSFSIASIKLAAGKKSSDGFSYLPARETAVFWDGLTAAAVTLSTFQESAEMPVLWNEVEDAIERAPETVKEAAKDAAEAAGELAAGAAEFVAEVAGRATKGFFTELGIMTVVIAGGAAFVLFRVL